MLFHHELTSHVWDFNEHGWNKVDALQQLQVNVHVEGHLTLFLDLFLFGSSLVLTLKKETLSQKLLSTAARLNVQQRVVSLFDVSVTECTQAKLNHGAIVKNLGSWIQQMDSFLKTKNLNICTHGYSITNYLEVWHKHQITSFIPFIMQSIMIDVAQQSFRANSLFFVVYVDVSAQFVHYVKTRFLLVTVILCKWLFKRLVLQEKLSKHSLHFAWSC